MPLARVRKETRVSHTVIVAFLLLSSVFVMIPNAAANPTSGTIETFTDGTFSVDLATNPSSTTSTNVTIQRNTTIGDATFQISYDSNDPSPGQLTLDIDSDGFYEWHLGGSGFGDLGAQTTFSSGTNNTSISTNGNQSWLQAGNWNLPSGASMSQTDLSIGFSPILESQFTAVGNIKDLVVGDMDGDGNEDGIFLVEDHVGTNGSSWPHIGWTRWNSTSTSLQTSWFGTCSGAERLITGDANGDGKTDLLAIDSIEKTLCQHLSGTSGWAHSVNLTMDSLFADAILADIDSDGQDDLVSIDADGELNSRIFSAGAFGPTGTPATINSGTSVPGMNSFRSLAAGQFFGTGLTIVVSEEDMTTNYNTLWNFSANTWIVSTQSFECMGGAMQVMDWNLDGFDDIIGTSLTGGCMATWNGTGWGTSSLTTAGMFNFTIGDHDRDGTPGFFSSDPGNPDGSDSSFTGYIEARDFDGNGGLHSNSTSFTPYTSPRDILFADLDGDGLSEKLVVAGESSLGLWVGAWQTVEWDLEGDGVIEMAMEGYASSTSPLGTNDQGNIITNVGSELATNQIFYDFYGITWAAMEPVFRSQGAGTMTQSNLNMTYTAAFVVELNPSNMNLSNVLNNHMLLGVGDIVIPLDFTSTMAGEFSLNTLEIEWEAGVNNIPLPPAPTLSLTDYNFSQVNLTWTNSTDCVGYELYRAPVSTQISLFAPPHAVISPLNNTYTDTDAVTNMQWDYAIRSIHNHSIYSPISNIVQVSVPDYPPIVDTTPPDAPIVSLNDVPNDQGDTLNLSWQMSTSNDVMYTLIYFELVDFSNASGLTPVANVSGQNPMTSMLMTGLDENSDYWAAAVAVDTSNNAYWNVVTVGPVSPINNSVRSSDLILDIVGAGDFDDGTHSGIHVKSGSPLSIGLELTSESVPLDNEIINIQLNTGTTQVDIPVTTNIIGSVSQSWTDWLDFVAVAGPHGGEIVVTASWGGGIYSNGQQISPSSTTSTIIVTVDATLSTSTPTIQLDSNDAGTTQFTLTSSAAEQSLLTGQNLDWQVASIGVIGQSGQMQFDANGDASLPVTYLTEGWVNVTVSSPPWWLNIQPSSTSVILVPYDHSTDPEPEPEPETYELVWVTFDCGNEDWEILGNSSMAQINLQENSAQCTLTNPNNVSAFLVFSFSYSESTPTFSHDLAGSQVQILENGTLDFTISPDSWTTGAIPNNGSITITITMTATDWITASNSFPLYYGFVSVPDSPDNTPDNNESGGSSSESESGMSTMLIVAIIVVVLAIVGMVGLRMVMSRSDDEYDVDDEEDEDWMNDSNDESEVIEIPKGKSLEELTTMGSSSRPTKAKPKPSTHSPAPVEVYKEAYEEPQEGHWEEETEHDYTQDEDYHVDDEGVEWWKDEVGQWWYKYPDEEDWEAFEA
ncbi:MAG: VCBS repeat-containing protein [Candidatus Thalassarchaeaceae archaeon]|nr:VCBS repeat-containing protein [Candidatus Thalassarchaeaceae archaeon]